MASVIILGAGVMGSAMSLPLADRGYQVRLVGTPFDVETIESIKSSQPHPKLNVVLPRSVIAFQYTQLAETFDNSVELILFGVASAGVNWATAQLASVLKKPVPILMITKGMAADGKELGCLPDKVAQALEKSTGFKVPVAAIGGPCIAGELAVRRPTGTVIVAHDFALALRLCENLQTEYYQPRPSLDVIGVETCAAFKNFFAIAVGWAHGAAGRIAATENKALNHNAAAILFDQAIREMMVLVKSLGGSVESVWGLAGAGDLYVTCQAGRNSRLGHHLGSGLSYSAVKLGPMKDETIEGAELGLAVAATIHSMIAAGKLQASQLPLTLALINALQHNSEFIPSWDAFHRSY